MYNSLFLPNRCAKCPNKNNPLGVEKKGDGGKVLVIIPSITREQIRRKSLFAGKLYNYINVMLKRNGIEDYYMTSAVMCGNYYKNSDITVEDCNKNRIKALKGMGYKYVLSFGYKGLAAAMSVAVAGDDGYKIGHFDRWTGHKIPRKDHILFPVSDPQEALYNRSDDPLYDTILKREIKQACDCINTNYNKRQALEGFEYQVLHYSKDIRAWVKAQKAEYYTFDLETSGLKPDNKGHFISSAGISTGDKTISFLVNSDTVQGLQWFAGSRFKKAAHNSKFDIQQIEHLLGVEVKNLWLDTMLACFIEDNRKASSGLKFRAYVELGIPEYDAESKPFLKAPTSNALNRIKDLDKNKELEYVATDAYATALLAEKHKETRHSRAYKLWHDTSQAFKDMERTGINIDKKALRENLTHAAKKKREIYKKIIDTRLGGVWRSTYYEKTNFSSPDQLRWMLYSYLRKPITKKTEKGAAAVDKEILNKYAKEYPLFKYLLNYKLYDKLEGTYLKNIKLETDENSVLHTNLNLNIVKSYRTSSANPNLQNMPIRDPEMSKYIRNVFKPSKGNRLVEIDYSSLEVRVSAYYHKDPNMLSYLNEGGDFHYDTAKDIYILSDEQMTSKLRKSAKGGFVFSQFYGDYYKNCAENIWGQIIENNYCRADGKPIFEHLREQGISTLPEFIEHIKQVEHIFWNKRFNVYGQWKEDVVKDYRKSGFMEGLSGFTYSSHIHKNAIFNVPVQGTAAHILLRALCIANDYLKDYKTNLVLQIHDSILLDLCPEEAHIVLPVIKEIMEKTVLEYYPFAKIAPLSVDFEATPVDGAWDTKEEVEMEDLFINT